MLPAALLLAAPLLPGWLLPGAALPLPLLLLLPLEAATASQFDSARSTAAAARARASAFHRWLSSAGPGCATSSTVEARASRVLFGGAKEAGRGVGERRRRQRRQMGASTPARSVQQPTIAESSSG